MQTKDEENVMVDKAITTYINEMIKHTQKVYTLSVTLTERDPTSAYESIHESLEKVCLPVFLMIQSGLSNLFNLFWEKLVHILRQSL